MNKKFTIIISIFAIIVIAISAWAYYLKLNYIDCYDCGEGGWLKTYECSQIDTKEAAFDCIYGHSSGDSNFPKPQSTEDLTELYIKEKTLESSAEPFPDSIFVYSFQRMAVDNQGNVYVETYLG